MNLKFRLKKIGEIRNYLIQEIHRNVLMSKKHKNVWIFWIILSCKINLNYIDHSLIVVSITTGCVSISAFASLFGLVFQ